MCTQMANLFRYQGVEYSLCQMSNGTLFNPRSFGLQPVCTCSACWLGYQTVFALADRQLVLDELHINLYAFPEGTDEQFPEGTLLERLERSHSSKPRPAPPMSVKGPPINGVSPIIGWSPAEGGSRTGTRARWERFNNQYVGIDLPLKYTGAVLLGDRFIELLHPRFALRREAWKYARIVELDFEKGVLTHEFDRSERMNEIQQQIFHDILFGDSFRSPTDDELWEYLRHSSDRV